MSDLRGWVVVVAGEAAHLADVSTAAIAAGAAVGVVSAHLADATAATVRFRADPRNPDAWGRVAMHIEQHLGPVDGVVTDASSHETVEAVFATDLSRRGRAPVRIVAPSDSPDDVVTALFGTPPATPSPPAAARRDR